MAHTQLIDLYRRMSAAVQAAREAGSVILNRDPDGLELTEKGPHDIVTAYDTLAEQTIVRLLSQRFPEDRFLGEENGSVGAAGLYGGRWIIDPIDGTVNFSRGNPDHAVSIAYEDGDSVLVLGVVYNPARDELFTAIQGEGAFLNGNPIHVSDTSDPSQAITAISLPHRRRDLYRPYAGILERIFLSSRDIRNLGSAALHVCSVACARMDGFVEYALKYWDVAAALVILNEAGGSWETIDPAFPFPDNGDIIVSNGTLHRWYTETVRRGLERPRS
jgi:myo-inositol-1(or 4)-monophosphatase